MCSILQQSVRRLKQVSGAAAFMAGGGDMSHREPDTGTRRTGVRFRPLAMDQKGTFAQPGFAAHSLLRKRAVLQRVGNTLIS